MARAKLKTWYPMRDSC